MACSESMAAGYKMGQRPDKVAQIGFKWAVSQEESVEKASRCQACSAGAGFGVYIGASDRWIATRGKVRGGQWCRTCAKAEAVRRNVEACEWETARHGPVIQKQT